MPSSPALAETEPKTKDTAAAAGAEKEKKRGWFRGLFKKKADESDAEEGAKKASKPQVKPKVEAKEEEPQEGAKKKGAFGGLGKKLAGIFTLEEAPGRGEAREAKDAPTKRGPVLPGKADQFVVTEDGTPLYENGPLQVTPVDLKLEAGEIVTLVKWRKGWSDVKLSSGETGTVATDLLRKAKASDFPVEELAVKTPASGEKFVEVTLPDLLPLLEPVPLPSVDDGAPGEGAIDASGLNPLLLPPLPE